MEFFKVSNHLIVVGNLTDADEEQTDLTIYPRCQMKQELSRDNIVEEFSIFSQ